MGVSPSASQSATDDSKKPPPGPALKEGGEKEDTMTLRTPI